MSNVSKRKFFFKDKTPEEIIKILDKEKPIKLRNHEDFINRVHERYPVLSKPEIALIVRAFFSTLRDLLVKGHTITLSNFFIMKFHCFRRPFKNTFLPHLDIGIKTSKKFKQMANEFSSEEIEEDESEDQEND